MSSAKEGRQKAALCSHISSFLPAFFYRAKPVTELERSGSEVHCGSGEPVPQSPQGDAAGRAYSQSAAMPPGEPTANPRRCRRRAFKKSAAMPPGEPTEIPRRCRQAEPSTTQTKERSPHPHEIHPSSPPSHTPPPPSFWPQPSRAARPHPPRTLRPPHPPPTP